MSVLSMSRSWRFGPEVTLGCTEADFDDSQWERVTLPHATRTLPWHGFDDRAVSTESVYRRRFRLPSGAGDRVFLDFDGVMLTASVTLNGVPVGVHRGGYVPFSFEVSEHVRWTGDNVLAVVVDSTEDPGIPPYGGKVDYLGLGGIYRDVHLRLEPDTFIRDVFAKPVRVLGPDPAILAQVELDMAGEDRRELVLELALSDDTRIVASTTCGVVLPATGDTTVEATLEGFGAVELWDLDRPRLYRFHARLWAGGQLLHERSVRIGFREARFTPRGFMLNGRHVKLRGVNRHQTYPYVGDAMPERVQRKDAEIIKHELKCNVVRTSHYPQSPHFLDRCDEIGLLVVEEIPGWQHLGGPQWQELSCRDVSAMVRRDRNRPAVILWGVRINESADDREFYTRTNQIALALDDSRPTGGTRDFADSELLEDVFTINDFDPFRLRSPNHSHYLNTEFAGHTFPTKPSDNTDRVQEQLLRHAWVLDQLAGDDRYAGGIAWCAFDYNTHAYSGSGDGVCYHGVADIFRIPKPVASLYRSQCSPDEEVVLDPAFVWATGELHWQVLEFHRATGLRAPWGGGPGHAVICSNCDRIRLHVGDELIDELVPDRKTFANLRNPPFVTDALARRWGNKWHDLRIEGYLAGRLVATRWLSGRAVDARFEVAADDSRLLADGRDTTRITLRVTDEYGNRRPYATGAVSISIEGPGYVVGENPFALVGGVGAVWLRTTGTPGDIRLRATHATLGTRCLFLVSREVPDEAV